MSDEIQRLSDELARDPASMVFLELGEQLRRRSELDLAMRIALRGLERHSHSPEAHDLLARISVDLGDLDRAFDEWDTVLRLVPDHVGARKGIGYVLFKQGRTAEAEVHLDRASALDPADATIAMALAKVRQSLAPDTANGGSDRREVPPARSVATEVLPGNGSRHPGTPQNGDACGRVPDDARMLFADALAHGEQTALLVDADGLVAAGIYVTADGDDVSHEVGAALSTIRDEAQRATQHVLLGEWQAVVVEADAATIALAPATHGTTVMLAAAVTVPLGMVKRTLERCRARAIGWLESGT